MKSLICWLKGHDLLRHLYRTPVYKFWKFDSDKNKYYEVDTVHDQSEIQRWCHRCDRYIKNSPDYQN